MDFNLKQWRDQQHESEEEQQHQHSSAAKIPRYLLLDSPQQQHQQQQQQQQQQQEVAALPLFVSADSHQPNKINTHLSGYPDHSSSTPTAIPTRLSRGGRYSFSLAQWQELELQALIYKHMAAGASVPPDLLQLVKKSIFASSASPYYLHHYSPHFQPAAALLQAGYWGKGAMDPEPGRCRRTDGKKWRCSRDVVAGHKYCERHMHRGRNRSRKPVEIPATATAASAPANNGLVGLLNNNASTTFAARSAVAASTNDTQFSLSRSGASSFDAFQLNHGSSDKKTLFGSQVDSSVSGDGGRSSNNSSNNNNNNRVLMHLFDDWPRSDNGEGNTMLSSTSLSISTPNPTSDFLRLSTGNSDELGRMDGNGNENGNEERERGQHMNWSNAGGWGANSMGGPLAEALRSSSNSSPTSVLHQLPRSTADTRFVSA